MSESISLNVTGMKCGGCENNVKGKLEALEGVLSVNASHKEKKVVVVFDDSRIDLQTIKETIRNAGFEVS